MRRILVPDDERHTLAVGVRLKQCGFRVALTDGGANGLTAMNDRAFDLTIRDVFMPNVRGFGSVRVFDTGEAAWRDRRARVRSRTQAKARRDAYRRCERDVEHFERA